MYNLTLTDQEYNFLISILSKLQNNNDERSESRKWVREGDYFRNSLTGVIYDINASKFIYP